MNALTWGFNDFGYSNVRAVGTEQPFDWVIGIASKLFIEQKMMAFFSALRRRGRYFLGTGRLENSAPNWLSSAIALLFVIEPFMQQSGSATC